MGERIVDFFGEILDNWAVFKLVVEREQVCEKRIYIDVDVLHKFTKGKINDSVSSHRLCEHHQEARME